MKLRNTPLAALGLAFAATAAHAEIKVGVVLSSTSPAASLGIPKRTRSRCCRPPSAAKGELHRARRRLTPPRRSRTPAKLTVEDGVDVIIGSTTSPASLAMVDVAETKTHG